MIHDLITDRTEADVIARNPKAFLGPDTLNRVESTVAELAELGKQLDIRLDLATRTNWGVPGAFPDSFPTESEMARYLGNVRKIRDGFGLVAPLPVSMRRLTHMGANNIEKALALAYLRVERTVPNFIFCGDVFAGEE